VPAGQVSVFPNPVSNKTTIYLANDVINVKGLSLFDSYGKSHPIKMVKQISDQAIEVDLSKLSSGMYFMRIKGKAVFKTISIMKL
jgi:hypothetical protein